MARLSTCRLNNIQNLFCVTKYAECSMYELTRTRRTEINEDTSLNKFSSAGKFVAENFNVE